MKCEFCNGNLSLEDLRCPHCGQMNKHAQQHIKAMQQYQGEFEETKEDVINVTKKYSQITVRSVIIVVLLILFFVVIVIGSDAYSLRRDFQRKDAQKHKKEYMEQIDAYIEAEDFLSLSSFFDMLRLDMYDINEDYAVYIPVERVVGQYDQIDQYIMRLQEEKERPDYLIDYLGDSLDYFYKYMDEEYYYETLDPSVYEKAWNAMDLYVKQLLQTYCSLTEEEAEGFKDMTKAKRIVLLEERMGYEE